MIEIAIELAACAVIVASALISWPSPKLKPRQLKVLISIVIFAAALSFILSVNFLTGKDGEIAELKGNIGIMKNKIDTLITRSQIIEYVVQMARTTTQAEVPLVNNATAQLAHYRGLVGIVMNSVGDSLASVAITDLSTNATSTSYAGGQFHLLTQAGKKLQFAKTHYKTKTFSVEENDFHGIVNIILEKE